MAWINEPEIPLDWKLERLRLYRDELLKETDFRVLEDAPGDRTAWFEYRQALRDLPSSVTDSSEIVFPEQPN